MTHWIIEKESSKNIYICFIDYAKAFDCMDHNKLWKILKYMGIPDHLTCLMRICMQVRKQQLELDMEHDCFQIRKEVRQGCILSPCLFNLYTEYIMKNVGLDEAQAGIQDCQEKYQKPQIGRWHHPYGRKWRRTKEPLDEHKRGG